MRINNNIMAMNTHRQYGIANSGLSKSAEKLSSGYRINRAGDDAAGLAISEKMRAQIRGLTMASKNSQDAISLVQTAEGALQETHNILQRMRELSVQARSDTNQNEVDRQALDMEFEELMKEVDDTANKTKFNNMGLIDGTFDKSNNKVAFDSAGKRVAQDIDGADLTIQTGANKGDELAINIKRMDAAVLGLRVEIDTGEDLDEVYGNFTDDYDPSDSSAPEYAYSEAAGLTAGRLNLLNGENASHAIKAVDDAINAVSTQRAQLGALQNRLTHKISNLDTSAENLQAAESRIRDIDMAKEMTNYTKQNILIQASTAMLAQANQAPQNVLSLLR